jgi:hypothetical protein
MRADCSANLQDTGYLQFFFLKTTHLCAAVQNVVRLYAETEAQAVQDVVRLYAHECAHVRCNMIRFYAQ